MKYFSEKDAAKIIHQVLLALNYMHKRNIVHRDIKPENILLESRDIHNINIKITDFGLSKCYDPLDGGLQETLGSPLYMAPEIIKLMKYDTKVDIWSLGVMAYIILTGKPPFNGKTKEEVFMQITTAPITFSESIWLKISREGKAFVKACLTRDPRLRPSAEELLNHIWIVQNIDKPKVTK